MHPPKASSTPIDGTSREGNDSHREGEESFPPPKSGEQSNDQNANDSSISTKSTSDENLPPKRSADNRVLFPEKLMRILDSKKYESIFSWNKAGDAIIIHKPYELISEVLTTHFGAKDDMKYDSFLRKLYRWGFSKLIVGGKSSEGEHLYIHENFREGDYESCSKVVCISKPSTTRPRRRPKSHDHTNQGGQAISGLGGPQLQIYNSSFLHASHHGLNFGPPSLLQRIEDQNTATVSKTHNGTLVNGNDTHINNMLAPNQQWYNNNNAAMTPEGRYLQMQLLQMANMDPSSVNGMGLGHQQHQQVENLSAQNHQLSSHATHAIPLAPQNYTSAPLSSRLPSHTNQATQPFHASSSSQFLGNTSAAEISHKIDTIRQENSVLQQLADNFFRQSTSSRLQVPQHQNAVERTSAPINMTNASHQGDNRGVSGTDLTRNHSNLFTDSTLRQLLREREIIQNTEHLLRNQPPRSQRANAMGLNTSTRSESVPAAGSLANNFLQQDRVIGTGAQQGQERSNLPMSAEQLQACLLLAEISNNSMGLVRNTGGVNGDCGPPSSQRRRLH